MKPIWQVRTSSSSSLPAASPGRAVRSRRHPPARITHGSSLRRLQVASFGQKRRCRDLFGSNSRRKRPTSFGGRMRSSFTTLQMLRSNASLCTTINPTSHGRKRLGLFRQPPQPPDNGSPMSSGAEAARLRDMNPVEQLHALRPAGLPLGMKPDVLRRRPCSIKLGSVDLTQRRVVLQELVTISWRLSGSAFGPSFPHTRFV